MGILSKKERVLRTMAGEETDRVPLYDILICNQAIEYFSGEKLPRLEDTTEVREHVQRLTGQAVNRFLDMTRSFGFGPLVDRKIHDEYGFEYQESTWEKTSWVIKRPFIDEDGAEKYLEWLINQTQAETRNILANPRAYRNRFRREFEETITAYIGDTIHLLVQHGTGLDEILYRVGFKLLAYLMVDEMELLSTALETITDNHIAICHAVADPELSPVVLTYCDVAYKEHLLYSPRFLRQEIFPRIQRMNEAWHEHGIKCLYHSDGYLMPVLDDLVATGIDGLNPIETVAGMSLKEVRQRYPKLFLAGGIDMSQLLSNGTVEEVRQVCRQAIRDTYPGYFMGSTTEADNSCKAENLVAMYEVAMEGVR